MLKSCVETKSPDAHIVLVFDESDPLIEDNETVAGLYGIPFLQNYKSTLTECFNQALCAFPDYSFYHMTNDDVLYQTAGWDNLLIAPLKEKCGISYGNDGLQGQNLPTFPMLSGDIVRSVGFLQMPLLTKYCGDVVWQEIGRMAKCLHYIPEVEIEHLHFINNKRDNDDAEFQNTYDRDRMMFANWIANDSIKDIRNVRRVVQGHPNQMEGTCKQ